VLQVKNIALSDSYQDQIAQVLDRLRNVEHLTLVLKYHDTEESENLVYMDLEDLGETQRYDNGCGKYHPVTEELFKGVRSEPHQLRQILNFDALESHRFKELEDEELEDEEPEKEKVSVVDNAEDRVENGNVFATESHVWRTKTSSR
jgi:hypothetical protein